MLDLGAQYLRFKYEIDSAVQEVFRSAQFISGDLVKDFCTKLAIYMDVPHIISCANGTDALRIALQALNIGHGCDVIVPAFTYIAPVEAVATTGASPIVVDVDPVTFNINPELLEKAVTSHTKAIIAVHLFGQSANMEAILKVADKYKLAVIEDNAQSLGSCYTFSDGRQQKAGCIGTVGITSFFPTKPLGCYGDGGALFTHDAELAETIRMLANHGQTEKYYHKIVGSNSRLDTVQAAILNVKLKYFNDFTARRVEIADRYYKGLEELESCGDIILPGKSDYSTHVFHQFTLRIQNGKRDALKAYLAKRRIQSKIYYPMPVHEQEGYKWIARVSGNPEEAKRLCDEVLSIPVCPEMTNWGVDRIIIAITGFFTK